MGWVLILTIMASYGSNSSTATTAVGGFASEAACQRAGARHEKAVNAAAERGGE